MVGPAPWLQTGELVSIGSVVIQTGWYRSRVVAWLLAGLTVLALVAALVLVVLNASRVHAGRVGLYVLLAVAVLVYAGTGRLIASRLPGNGVGWLATRRPTSVGAEFARNAESARLKRRHRLLR